VVTFQGVARAAGVSRQWLYTQPELRAAIERLRTARPSTRPAVPAGQRASERSPRQRVSSLGHENQHLREENASLKQELAIAYGHQRQNGTPARPAEIGTTANDE
jgi:hypothetical protein